MHFRKQRIDVLAQLIWRERVLMPRVWCLRYSHKAVNRSPLTSGNGLLRKSGIWTQEKNGVLKLHNDLQNNADALSSFGVYREDVIAVACKCFNAWQIGLTAQSFWLGWNVTQSSKVLLNLLRFSFRNTHIAFRTGQIQQKKLGKRNFTRISNFTTRIPLGRTRVHVMSILCDLSAALCRERSFLLTTKKTMDSDS